MNPRRLKSIPVFSGLDKTELRRAADCAEEIRVGHGEQLLVVDERTRVLDA